MTGFDLRRLLGVFNLTRAAILYVPGTAGLGHTAFNGSTNVLTLSADTTGHANSDALVVMYDKPGGDASDSKLEELRALLAALPLPTGAATETKVEALRALLAGTLKVAPPADQDPVFNHAAGVKLTGVNASVKLLDVPADCKYVRISCESDIVVNTTAAGPAADDGKSIRIAAGPAEVIPVVSGAAVWGMSLSGVATTVRVTPLKARA
ncbi:hypothetical protein [uncultured Methylobacterium sp.]|uniref:hypothetical protein n=1 Tax=uncultured Methylobacterium sp. TaxID=157278 RepID=UPI002630BA58|nr:hypothetical protein [uncultured Methylobacterium sp.]